MRKLTVTTPVYHRDFSESLILKVNPEFQALPRARGGESGIRTHGTLPPSFSLFGSMRSAPAPQPLIWAARLVVFRRAARHRPPAPRRGAGQLQAPKARSSAHAGGFRQRACR